MRVPRSAKEIGRRWRNRWSLVSVLSPRTINFSRRAPALSLLFRSPQRFSTPAPSFSNSPRLLSFPTQTVQNEDYFCHAHNADGLVGIAFADADYPARAAFGVVSSALENYVRQFGDAWRDAREDSAEGNPVCEAAVASHQDPASADKLTAIQRDLDETKVVLHKTIESVLARGEKLDALVDKSADLSLASQMFYKQARKTNSCCKMM